MKSIAIVIAAVMLLSIGFASAWDLPDIDPIVFGPMPSMPFEPCAPLSPVTIPPITFGPMPSMPFDPFTMPTFPAFEPIVFGPTPTPPFEPI